MHEQGIEKDNRQQWAVSQHLRGLISIFSSDVQLYKIIILEKVLLFLLLELLVIRITGMFRNIPR